MIAGKYKCPRSEPGSELSPGGAPAPQPPNPGGLGGESPPGFSSDPVSDQGHMFFPQRTPTARATKRPRNATQKRTKLKHMANRQ